MQGPFFCICLQNEYFYKLVFWHQSSTKFLIRDFPKIGKEFFKFLFLFVVPGL